jgi:hypothetical protein
MVRIGNFVSLPIRKRDGKSRSRSVTSQLKLCAADPWPKLTDGCPTCERRSNLVTRVIGRAAIRSVT